MSSSNYRFTLNMQEEQSQVSLPVKHGDTNRKLYISIADGGKPFTIEKGSVALFVGKKADGNEIETHCEIEGESVVRYDFDEQTASYPGTVDCEIRLYDKDGKLLASPRFIMVVDERVVYDIVTPEYITLLDQLLGTEAIMKNNEIFRQGNEDKRIDNEYIRRENEIARGTAENTRKENEEARKTAETQRQKTFEENEGSRQKTFGDNEDSRQSTYEQNEETRNLAYDSAESSRHSTYSSAEDDRWTAYENHEISRESRFEEAERSRGMEFDEKEASRQEDYESAEASRAYDESKRVSAESARVTAEKGRVYAEQTRENRESSRQNAENYRIQGENSRNEYEQARRDAEKTRVSSESERVSNEESRVSAEQGRADAETLRELRMDAVEKKVEGCTNAIKASSSGEVVRIDGVSSNEHTIKCKISSNSSIDLSSVKVTRCGKNLFNKDDVVNLALGSPVNAEEKVMYDPSYRSFYIPCKEGEVYSISRISNLCPRFRYVFTATVPTNGVSVFGASPIYSDYSSILKYENVIVPPNANYLFLYLSHIGGEVDDVQIEVGSVATDYEPYKEAETFTPLSDGTVEGVMSVAPTMTLMTDTEGVTIEVEYNQDINVLLDYMKASLRAILDIQNSLIGGES